MENRETLELIKDQMVQHFKDDSRNFDLINATLMRHEELTRINGEHMSYIRKDITENKILNDKILKILEENSQKIEENRKATEPMVLAYNKDLIVKESDTTRGDKVIRWSILAGSAGVLGGTLSWVIHTFK